MKTLMELFVLIAGICLLAACTKTEDEAFNSANFLKIDLTSPICKSLNEVGGSVVFSSEGIIVGKTASDTPDQTFVAADHKCPCCSMQLCFSTDIANSGVWVCNCCQIKFDTNGFVSCGSSNMNLETYPVTQTENILTIFY
jgi:ribosomal protein L37AE/L43A